MWRVRGPFSLYFLELNFYYPSSACPVDREREQGIHDESLPSYRMTPDAKKTLAPAAHNVNKTQGNKHEEVTDTGTRAGAAGRL